MKALDDRVDDLEVRIKRLEPALVPDLGDILRSYPGGIARLAFDSGYHRESIYNFGVAKRTMKFPCKRAAAVARSFGSRKVFGHRVTIELLRRAWLVMRDQNDKDAQTCATDLRFRIAMHYGMEPDASDHQIEKAIYKGTDCGAWIKFTNAGLSVGSIVEGSDVDCESHHLKWPSDEDVGAWIDNALTEIEEEAKSIWNEWNQN